MSTIMQINPFEFFTDTDGDALDGGFIWIGEPNKDPRQYPVTAFYDAALTIPAPMPLRTSNGYIVRNGSPTFLYINGNYSIRVEDRVRRQIYYVPDFLMIGTSSAVSTGDLASPSGASMVGFEDGDITQRLGGSRISTKYYGVPLDGVTSAVPKLQELINKDVPIYLDAGMYLIDRTLLLRSTDMIGPGTLVIVCDSNFQIIGSHFSRTDSAICMEDTGGPLYTVNLNFNSIYTRSSSAKPPYPFRFQSLRNSVVNLNHSSIGVGAGLECNLPDTYRNNRNVDIHGTYTLTHDDTNAAGGMWVRDVDGTGGGSYGVTVKSGTKITNNGRDEALSFFNPNNGIMKKCGTEPGVNIIGRGIGLTVLNFSGNGIPNSDFDIFINEPRVEVTGLRINQAAIKCDFAAPCIESPTVVISGVESSVAAGFYAGVRNSNARADLEYPIVNGAKVYLDMTFQPVADILGLDGPLTINDAMTIKKNTANFNWSVSNGYKSSGGKFPDGINGAIRDTTFAYDFDTSLTSSNVKYFRERSRHGIEGPIVPDASGIVTITHSIFKVPQFGSLSLVNSSNLGIDLISLTSTVVTGRVYLKSTNAPVTTPVFVSWEVSL